MIEIYYINIFFKSHFIKTRLKYIAYYFIIIVSSNSSKIKNYLIFFFQFLSLGLGLLLSLFF